MAVRNVPKWEDGRTSVVNIHTFYTDIPLSLR